VFLLLFVCNCIINVLSVFFARILSQSYFGNVNSFKIRFADSENSSNWASINSNNHKMLKWTNEWVGYPWVSCIVESPAFLKTPWKYWMTRTERANYSAWLKHGVRGHQKQPVNISRYFWVFIPISHTSPCFYPIILNFFPNKLCYYFHYKDSISRDF
jgi:hypothetical protein